jgi:integrase
MTKLITLGNVNSPPRLLDQVRAAIRTKHYSPRTEEAYVYWVRQFILFHNKQHPLQLHEPEIASFLQHLAINKTVAASTQNQALNALVFLYGMVLKQPIGKLPNIVRAKRPRRLPSVLRQEQVERLFAAMKTRPWVLVPSGAIQPATTTRPLGILRSAAVTASILVARTRRLVLSRSNSTPAVAPTQPAVQAPSFSTEPATTTRRMALARSGQQNRQQQHGYRIWSARGQQC